MFYNFKVVVELMHNVSFTWWMVIIGTQYQEPEQQHSQGSVCHAIQIQVGSYRHAFAEPCERTLLAGTSHSGHLPRKDSGHTTRLKWRVPSYVFFLEVNSLLPVKFY